MAIKIGGRKGDLTGTSKDEKKARAASFSKRDNERVNLSKEQQSNGFKGESLNDHGLPDGRVQKEVDRPNYTGPKDRKQGAPMDIDDKKYAKGTKGIKIKTNPKMLKAKNSMNKLVP